MPPEQNDWIEEKRLRLQTLLEEILGSRNVYFQPPSENRLKYPCIVYELDRVDMNYAENTPYAHFVRFSITYISKQPNTIIPEKLLDLPMSAFSRFFTTDSLNHYVVNLYF